MDGIVKYFRERKGYASKKDLKASDLQSRNIQSTSVNLNPA